MKYVLAFLLWLRNTLLQALLLYDTEGIIDIWFSAHSPVLISIPKMTTKLIWGGKCISHTAPVPLRQPTVSSAALRFFVFIWVIMICSVGKVIWICNSNKFGLIWVLAFMHLCRSCTYFWYALKENLLYSNYLCYDDNILCLLKVIQKYYHKSIVYSVWCKLISCRCCKFTFFVTRSV